MLRKIVNIVILLPLAIVLILLSVANRQTVTLALNPFRPDDGLLSLQAPFYLFLFLALLVGVVVGSAATWFAQGRYRRRAERLEKENRKWQTARPVSDTTTVNVRRIEA